MRPFDPHGPARLDRLVTPWAETRPEAIAIQGPGGVLGYRALDELANQFARALARLGIGRGDRVGMYAPRSARVVAAMLGVVRLGAVFVPIDPVAPLSRAQRIAADCGMRLVVASPSLAGIWRENASSDGVERFVSIGDTVDGDRAPGVVAFSAVTLEDPGPVACPSHDPDDLAYILYTSGSTGVPKGVMLSHRNAMVFVRWAAELVGLGPTDRVANHAPFHFDLSVFDLWASLDRGATVILLGDATVGSGSRMVDVLHAEAITVWYSVPSALVLMLESGDLEVRGAPALRVVLFAGEVFPSKFLRRLMVALPGTRMFNFFGPTETNVCLYHEVEKAPAEGDPPVPAGRAACGSQITILNASGQPTPAGEVGELHVSGPTVMLGYWKNGAAAPAPVPYPTGDRVSERTDGALIYHGRRDQMVKIHGYRVEIGEVEAALHRHVEIREAIASEVHGRLAALVVPRTQQLSVIAVKRHLASLLPRYMIPENIRLVPCLPRTPSGKVDRVAVQISFLQGQAGGGDDSLRTRLERRSP